MRQGLFPCLLTCGRRNGGIRLMDGFVLDQAVLSEGEKKEILAALQSTRDAGESQTLQKLSARMHKGTWLTSFLLSFGTQVEILSPAYLREHIVEETKSIYEKNKT